MDDLLFGAMHEDIVREDEKASIKKIANGIAHHETKAVKRFVDKIINCASEQYPEGLSFEGSYRVDPYEEYRVVTKNAQQKKGQSRIFDLAPSNVYLVRYNFKFHGEECDPQYLYLPNIRKGGLMWIKGKQFVISPVLADKLFSVGVDNIFIQMPRGPATFKSEWHRFIANGVRVSKGVAWTRLHNRDAKKNKLAVSQTIQLSRVHCSLFHYLCCKFGLRTTFRKYGGVDNLIVIHENDFDPEKYPADKYVACRSTYQRPDTVKLREHAYVPYVNRLMLVIPVEDYTSTVEHMVSGFYYVMDHFPEDMVVEDVDSEWTWCRLMGYIIFGEEPPTSKLVEDIDTHLRSLDGYVDLAILETLKDEQIDCQDIYDIFGHIIENMNEMLMNSANRIGSMYGKQLMVLRYILKDINNSNFEFLFKLTSNNKKIMTKTDINTLLSRHFRHNKILQISSGEGHGEVSSVSSPNDNMYFKISSVIVHQSDTAGRGKGRETKPLDETMLLDASYSDAGSFLVLPKSMPIGNNRINLRAQLGPGNTVEQNTAFKEITDRTQRLFRRSLST